MFTHYLITIYNLGLYDYSGDKEWMRHRLSVFSRFTVASVLNQSCKNFVWFVLCDQRTPSLDRLKENLPVNAHIILAEGDITNKYISTVIRSSIGSGDNITTRLDNDDAISRDFIEKVQEQYEPGVSKTVTFPFGYAYDSVNDNFRMMEYRQNAFQSLIANDKKTVHDADHSVIRELAPINIFVDDKPYWIYVVHEQNMTNQMPSVGKKTGKRDLGPADRKLLKQFFKE